MKCFLNYEKKNCYSWFNWLYWKYNLRYNKKRPKVAELTLQQLRKLIVSRSKIYIKADFKINCDKLDKFQITKNILEFYEK